MDDVAAGDDERLIPRAETERLLKRWMMEPEAMKKESDEFWDELARAAMNRRRAEHRAKRGPKQWVPRLMRRWH